jgi:hypothetical protein
MGTKHKSHISLIVKAGELLLRVWVRDILECYTNEEYVYKFGNLCVFVVKKIHVVNFDSISFGHEAVY